MDGKRYYLNEKHNNYIIKLLKKKGFTYSDFNFKNPILIYFKSKRIFHSIYYKQYLINRLSETNRKHEEISFREILSIIKRIKNE